MTDARSAGTGFASDPYSGDHTDTAPRRRRSVLLIIAGLLAIVISVASLIGPEAVIQLFSLPLGWLLVIAATAAGALLLLKPVRKRDR